MAPGPGLWTTFFYYFSMTTVIGSFTASRALHMELLSPNAVVVGVLLGAIAGIGGTYLNRSVIWELPIQGEKVFSNQLEQTLRSLHYERISEDNEAEGNLALSASESRRVYARNGSAAAFGGRLYVEIRPDKAQIVGRSAAIRRLKGVL